MPRGFVILLALSIAVVAGEDPVVARHDLDVASARQAYTAAVARAQTGFQAKVRAARQTAAQALEQAARNAARSGDLAAANANWRELLRLDRGQAAARAHFSTLGTIDATLASLDLPAPGADPPTAAATTALANHRLQVADARQVFAREEGTARACFRVAQSAARERALVALIAQGRTALAQGGDMAAASLAYKQALRLDRRVAVARDFFTKAGNLDAVLAELGAEPGDVLPPPPEPQAEGDPGRSLLLVVGSPATPSAGERVLRERLDQAGWWVTVTAKVDAASAAGVAGIVITATANPANLDPALAEAAAGIAVMHPQIPAALLPGVTIGKDWKHDSGVVVAAGNPLGLTAGTVQVFAVPARLLALAHADGAVAHAAAPDIVQRKPQPGDAFGDAVRDHLKKQYGVDVPPEPAQKSVVVAVMAAIADQPAGAGKAGRGRRAVLFPCSEDLARLTPAGWKLLLDALAWTCQAPASRTSAKP